MNWMRNCFIHDSWPYSGDASSTDKIDRLKKEVNIKTVCSSLLIDLYMTVTAVANVDKGVLMSRNLWDLWY